MNDVALMLLISDSLICLPIPMMAIRIIKGACHFDVTCSPTGPKEDLSP